MKKKLFLIIALLCTFALGSWADETTGSWSDYRDTAWGTDYASASSFTVSTAAQLAQLAYMVNDEHKDFSDKTVTQTSNIDLSGHYWMPIGHYSGDQYFAGTFDGAGKTISGKPQMRGIYINGGQKVLIK